VCGRFILGVVREELERLVDDYYGIVGIGDVGALPRYNVAPGQEIVAVVGDGKTNRIGLIQWGFVPAFATSEKSVHPIINARAESLLEKAFYVDALTHRRCLVLADGFYEWKDEGTRKVPMRIFLKNERLFAMAGIWSAWTRPDGTKLHTCAIVTTAANDFMKPIHTRMPVILAKDAEEAWLGSERQDAKGLASLLVPYDDAKMACHAVSAAVNSVRAEGPSLIQPV
jgi:putative SOS response-associated peptidase YedK